MESERETPREIIERIKRICLGGVICGAMGEELCTMICEELDDLLEAVNDDASGNES